MLLVDDDPDVCELVRYGLASQKIEVTSCASGDEAFAYVSRREIDVVVTDLAMPGMHGFELIDRIVANHPDLEGVAKMFDVPFHAFAVTAESARGVLETFCDVMILPASDSRVTTSGVRSSFMTLPDVPTERVCTQLDPTGPN